MQLITTGTRDSGHGARARPVALDNGNMQPELVCLAAVRLHQTRGEPAPQLALLRPAPSDASQTAVRGDVATDDVPPAIPKTGRAMSTGGVGCRSL